MNPVLAEATVASNLADAVNLALVVMRVVLGVTMAAHGYNKFFRGGRLAGTGRWFDSMGMRPGKVHALLAASTEVGAGILLALGLLTPLAAGGFVGLMIVAAWTHRANGFFIAKDGWEYNMVLAVVAVGIAVMSPGEYSLDWVLGLDFSFDPTVAFLLSAVVGSISGIGLLALCYRPPAPADD